MSDDRVGKTYFRESLPQCPYCGRKEEEWYECLSDSEGWGEGVSFECGHCEKKYSLEREIMFTSKPSCDFNGAECEQVEIQKSITAHTTCKYCDVWEAVK